MSTQQLKRNHLLKGLHADDLRLIEEAGKMIRVSPHETVIYEDRPNEYIYLVVSGSVNVILPDASGSTGVPLANLKPGDCFGEYSFVDSQPPNTRVLAAEPTELFQLRHSVLEALLESNPAMGKTIYLNLLTHLVDRLRDSNAELDMFRL
jgi:CRP-like cAMP-binding protein